GQVRAARERVRRGVGGLVGREARGAPRVLCVGRDGQGEAVAVLAADEVGDAQGGCVGGGGVGVADGDVDVPDPGLGLGCQAAGGVTVGVGGVVAGVAGGARLPLPAALVHGFYGVSSSAPLGGLVGGRGGFGLGAQPRPLPVQHRQHRVGLGVRPPPV